MVAKEQPFTELQAKNKHLEESLEEQTKEVKALRDQVQRLMDMMDKPQAQQSQVMRSETLEDQINTLIDSDDDFENDFDDDNLNAAALMGPKRTKKRK
jgi:predicted RNase H-like nuclease (RuvC/YqgF family)